MDNGTYSIAERFRIRVVENLDDFDLLREGWDDLAEKSLSYVPWLRHDWYRLWLGHFLGGAKLFIVVLYRKDEMTAIAPFMITREGYKGVPGVRRLELIGNVHSPVRSFLFRDWSREERLPALSGIMHFLGVVRKKWDVLELVRVPEEYPLIEDILQLAEDAGLKHRSYFTDANWFLGDIDCSFSSYFENLARKHKKDVNRCRRKLEDLGALRAEIIRDDQRLDHYLSLYDSIRGRSWKAAEKDSEFLRKFMELAAGQGWARLAFLFLDDTPIAGEKWLVSHGTGWTLDGVYDEEYSKQSPGKVLAYETTREAIDEDKVSSIDYMTGDEEYKRQWLPNRRERRGLDLYNNTIRGWLLGVLMTRILPATEKHGFLASPKLRMSKYFRRKQ